MFDSLPRNSDEFKSSVMCESLAAIKINTLFDNYDPVRTLIDKNDNSCTFNAASHAFWIEWFLGRHELLYSAYTKFVDDQSRRLFLHLIAYRIGGHLCVRLPVSFDTGSEKYLKYRDAEGGVVSALDIGGLFPLRHLDFQWKGERYKVDTYSLEYYLHRRQYFFERDGVLIMPESGDYVIDGGACTGDSAIVFSKSVGPSGRVYAFDPVGEHIQLIEHNIRQGEIKNVEIMPFGLGNEDNSFGPISIGRVGPDFNTLGGSVPIRSLDRLMLDGRINRIDFIKLDVEGAELATISGALNAIDQMRPKLAISLYHKPDDIFSIILLLSKIFPFYDFYLDHYTIHHDETVLYAKAR